MDYATLKSNLVIPKIRQYGKPITIRRPGASSGWTKSWNAAQSRPQWTLNVAPFTVRYTDPSSGTSDTDGYAIEKAYQQKEINGTTVMANDRRFIAADIDAPTTDDKLVVDGVVLTIVSVQAIQPGVVTMLYTLQCRGV